jgi:hypothetical protein
VTKLARGHLQTQEVNDDYCRQKSGENIDYFYMGDPVNVSPHDVIFRPSKETVLSLLQARNSLDETTIFCYLPTPLFGASACCILTEFHPSSSHE